MPDYDFLYSRSLSPEVGYRWRFRGATPSPEAFVSLLWQDVVAQFMVCDRRSGRTVGFVTSYGASPRSDWVYLAAMFDPAVVRSGWPFEGVALFVDYLFRLWSFRKIYMEMLSFNLDAVNSEIGAILREEACFTEREFYAGKYWDMHVLSLHREDWEREKHRFLGATRQLAARDS